MITLDQAKLLKPGDILHDSAGHRWKVNGIVKTWKSDPTRIRVPLKHGLYAYGALLEYDFPNGECPTLTIGEPPAIRSGSGQKGGNA